MWNRTVSMATHYMILNNGGIRRKLIISQPVFNVRSFDPLLGNVTHPTYSHSGLSQGAYLTYKHNYFK